MNASAADDLESMFKEGKVSGQIRAFYINREMINSDYSRDGLAIGGKLGYETAALNGLSVGAMFYTTSKIDSENGTASHNDKTLFNSQDKGYTYLGQAYLNYKIGNTNLKVGRQELNTPLAGSDDARMLPNTFEAAVLTNTDVKDTTLIAAHVTEISYGTFSNAYVGGALALASGYGNGYASFGNSYDNGQYHSMSQAALGTGVKNSGVSAVAAIYKGISGLSLQLWDYYAYDILNAIYAEANYGWSYANGVAPYVAAQYIHENNVGADFAGKVNSNFTGAKAGVKAGNFDIYGAVSHNDKDSQAQTGGGTISPWGGMPAYTQGMVTRHQFFADTTAYKAAGSYNLKDLTGTSTTAGIYYTAFDIGNANAYQVGKSWRVSESGFDIINDVQSVKGLQLRFRGNYQREFAPNDNRNEYRIIANYNF
jgi:hypothetical protein